MKQFIGISDKYIIDNELTPYFDQKEKSAVKKEKELNEREKDLEKREKEIDEKFNEKNNITQFN